MPEVPDFHRQWREAAQRKQLALNEEREALRALLTSVLGSGDQSPYVVEDLSPTRDGGWTIRLRSQSEPATSPTLTEHAPVEGEERTVRKRETSAPVMIPNLREISQPEFVEEPQTPAIDKTPEPASAVHTDPRDVGEPAVPAMPLDLAQPLPGAEDAKTADEVSFPIPQIPLPQVETPTKDMPQVKEAKAEDDEMFFLPPLPALGEIEDLPVAQPAKQGTPTPSQGSPAPAEPVSPPVLAPLPELPSFDLDTPVAQPSAPIAPEPVSASQPTSASSADGGAEVLRAVLELKPTPLEEIFSKLDPTLRVPEHSKRPNQFLEASQDPMNRIRRLARTLVGDIVAYHPEVHAKALAAGPDEIQRVFASDVELAREEFFKQVDEDDAPEAEEILIEALNQVLANGQNVF